MLPQIIKSAVSSCVVKALCKKANSRKQIRAFLVKLAADKLQNAYKFAPRGSTTQHMSPVPGAKGREQLLRPSMTKVSFSAASSPKLPGAPAAPKAPAALKAPAAPKAPTALKAPGYPGSSGMNAAMGGNMDTTYDLANMQNSPGSNFYSDQNPTYAAMRSPDPARLAPKPQMRPGMSNQINYGTGPSGNPVVADIIPGGTMPVGRPMGRTEAERTADRETYSNFNARTSAARAAAAAGQAAPGSPALTQLLAGMTPSQRLAYKKQNVFNSPEAYANRNQIASQELDRQVAKYAPELAPVPIPETQPQPTSTPVDFTSSPESISAPKPSIPTANAVQAIAQQLAFPPSAPTPNYANMSPSQQLNAAQSTAPAKSPLQADQPASMSPNAVIANLLPQLGQGAGRQVATPNLYDLFAKMRGGLGGGIQNLAGLFSQQPDDFQL